MKKYIKYTLFVVFGLILSTTLAYAQETGGAQSSSGETTNPQQGANPPIRKTREEVRNTIRQDKDALQKGLEQKREDLKKTMIVDREIIRSNFEKNKVEAKSLFEQKKS